MHYETFIFCNKIHSTFLILNNHSLSKKTNSNWTLSRTGKLEKATCSWWWQHHRSKIQTFLKKNFFFLVPRTHFDDEYNQLYLREPKILLTTSRNSSSRLMNFLKVRKYFYFVSIKFFYRRWLWYCPTAYESTGEPMF